MWNEAIKYSKGLAQYGGAEGIPSLPYGDSVLGASAFNLGNNLLNMAYNRQFGDGIIFGSASKHITRRYLASLAVRKVFHKIQTAPRREYLRQVVEFQDFTMKKYDERMAAIDAEAPLLKHDYISPYTGDKLDSYLSLTPVKMDGVPDRDMLSILSMGRPFVDSTAIINTSSKKNVIMTQVTGRSSTRKEYVSGGDVQLSVSGSICSNVPDVHPIKEVEDFVMLMEYGGVLEAEHIALIPHNINYIIVTDFKLDYKQGSIDTVEYSFSAVGIAPSKEVTYQTKVNQRVQDMLDTFSNKWLTGEILSQESENLGADRQAKIDGAKDKKGKNKVYKFIDTWL